MRNLTNAPTATVLDALAAIGWLAEAERLDALRDARAGACRRRAKGCWAGRRMTRHVRTHELVSRRRA